MCVLLYFNYLTILIIYYYKPYLYINLSLMLLQSVYGILWFYD